MNWNHGFNNGNTKPKIELLIKRKKKSIFNTLNSQCKSNDAGITIYKFVSPFLSPEKHSNFGFITKDTIKVKVLIIMTGIRM